MNYDEWLNDLSEWIDSQRNYKEGIQLLKRLEPDNSSIDNLEDNRQPQKLYGIMRAIYARMKKRKEELERQKELVKMTRTSEQRARMLFRDKDPFMKDKPEEKKVEEPGPKVVLDADKDAQWKMWYKEMGVIHTQMSNPRISPITRFALAEKLLSLEKSCMRLWKVMDGDQVLDDPDEMPPVEMTDEQIYKLSERIRKQHFRCAIMKKTIASLADSHPDKNRKIRAYDRGLARIDEYTKLLKKYRPD